jgi:hypothetical protein
MQAAGFFVNLANEAPSAPTLNNPSNNGQVTTLTPVLKVNAAGDPDNDALTYEYEVSKDNSFNTRAASGIGAGTSWTVDTALQDNTTYYWRARARDVHSLEGGWMANASFTVNNNGYNDPPVVTVSRPAASEPVLFGGSFTVQWTASDPDSIAVITLGYDTTGSGCNGTQIATTIQEKDGPDSYAWNIASIPQGTYYIYVSAADGTTTTCAYGAGPLHLSDAHGDLNHDGTVDVADALKALRISAGLDVSTAAELAEGDVAPVIGGKPQPDGTIALGDVVVILRKAVGLVTW